MPKRVGLSRLAKHNKGSRSSKASEGLIEMWSSADILPRWLTTEKNNNASKMPLNDIGELYLRIKD